jgi:hypothetical protein
MTRRSTTSAKAKETAPPAPTITKIPPTQVLPRLAALQTATASELKEQWRALFDMEPPPFNRAYLVSRLSYRVQELAYQPVEEVVVQLRGSGPKVTAMAAV